MAKELKTVEESLQEAMTEIEDKHEETAPEEEQEEVQEREATEEGQRGRDEAGKFVKKADKQEKTSAKTKEVELSTEKEQAKVQPEKQELTEDAPKFWTPAVKEHWSKLPPDVRAEISKREGEIHKMFTRHDGDLNFGRELKEVITPYIPVINAEGGTPAKAVASLLNTAYQLRTSSPERKAQLIHEIAQTYGVDLTKAPVAAQVDPQITALQNRINQFEQNFTQQQSLQQKEEQGKLQGEVNAFAADPKNIYFEQVKAAMAPLLASEQAKNLQEAYDMACWARPDIRAVLLKKQSEDEGAKKKENLAKKKQASAASISGSPGANQATPTNSKKSLEESLRDSYEEIIEGRV